MSLINPFAGFAIPQGWLDGSHKNNPAIDYKTPIGFVFGAPGPGIYYRRPSNLSRTDESAAGHLGELFLTEGPWKGHRIRFGHLDEHIARTATRVGLLEPLAATGNTGYVRPRPTVANPHAGAHVHTYGLTPSGARWDWTRHAIAPAAAGTSATPISPEEDDMSQAAEDAILAIKAALLDGRPETGMARGALDVIYDGVRDMQERMYPKNAEGERFGWDAFDELVRGMRALLTTAGRPVATVDVGELAASIRDGLGEDVAEAIGRALVRGSS